MSVDHQILESGSLLLLENGSSLLLESSGSVASSWVASTLDPDLVAYLSAAIGRQLYAPLKRGLRFRYPVNTFDDPIVSYARVFANRPLKLSGPSAVVEALYQIDVFAIIFDDALAVAEQVRFAMQGFSGQWGNSVVIACNLRGESHAWLENEDPKKVGVYRFMSEFQICYRESVRTF